MPPKKFPVLLDAARRAVNRWPLVNTVATAPRIHRVVHRCRRLRRLRLRRRHPTGRQSQCVIRPTRNIPIRCANRFGQSQCVIRRTRRTPIRSDNRLPIGRRGPSHSRDSKPGSGLANPHFPASAQEACVPRNSCSAKRERQYAHIKDSLLECGQGEHVAAQIAARTFNKERARHGESEQANGSSINDMSASRRGGPRSHEGAGGRTLAQLRNEASSGHSRFDIWAA